MPLFVSKCIGEELSLNGRKSRSDLDEYFSKYISFWKENTYDAFSYEAAICEILPGHGAILGGMLGPIQTRDDFDRYPFDDIPRIFWETYQTSVGVYPESNARRDESLWRLWIWYFETAQDLVGYESLCVMQYLDPELLPDIFLENR